MPRRPRKNANGPNKVLISCSILAADFTRLGAQVKACEKGGADYLHLDVMDGRFAPNFAVGFHDIEAARRACRLPLDAHLMIEKPDAYLKRFVEAGCNSITLHLATLPDPRRSLRYLRRKGVKAGLALNPDDDFRRLRRLLGEIDLVLQMTVFPGFYGQSFIKGSLARIETLRKMIDDSGRRILLQVDGGMNKRTLLLAVSAGADFIVAGNAVFGKGNIQRSLKELRRVAMKAQ